MNGKRLVSNLDLGDKLHAIKRTGVRVPQPKRSLYSPKYVGQRGDVEIYNHRGAEVQVRPGHVIDYHGNVVHLARLEQQAAHKRGEIPAQVLYQ